jgi:hypothetical protein
MSLEVDAVVAKSKMGVQLDYDHEWEATTTYMDQFSSNTDEFATGIDGDTVVGSVSNFTTRVYVYVRNGTGWESTFVKNEFVKNVRWIDKAVVSRAYIENAPFEVPEIPIMNRVTGECNRSFFSTADCPVTHTVTREFSSDSYQEIKVGLFVEQGGFEFEIQLTVGWGCSSSTTIETEFVLSDPDGVWCYASSNGDIDMQNRDIETSNFLFWFYY